MTSPGPLAPGDRVEALDAIRGLALYGVLVVNLVSSFRDSIFVYLQPLPAATPAPDRLAMEFIELALQGKALSLIAMLFGVGLAIQHERFAERGRAELMSRRLLVLLAFGLAHLLLVWNGDILAQYAVAGLIVARFLDRPAAALGKAAAWMFALSLLAPLAPWTALWPDPEGMQASAIEAARVYANGSYAQIRAYSIAEFLALFSIQAMLFPQTLGLFFLGAWAWRSGLAARPDEHRRALAAIAAVALLFAVNAPVILAIGYGTGLLLLLESGAARRLLAPVVAAGRMAFTNYIAQSLVFTTIFFGYGFGLFGRLGIAEALALGTAVYGLQVAASAWWLRHWRFGPLEWLWRSLTYGQAQPMRRAP
jgi:uncharacterized protein